MHLAVVRPYYEWLRVGSSLDEAGQIQRGSLAEENLLGAQYRRRRICKEEGRESESAHGRDNFFTTLARRAAAEHIEAYEYVYVCDTSSVQPKEPRDSLCVKET